LWLSVFLLRHLKKSESVRGELFYAARFDSAAK
jgi:hypothetical protein